jgi:23S rRNA pseudouridine1911/1915/1917 synthase
MILSYKNTDNLYFNIKQVAKEYFHISDRLLARLKNKQLIFQNGFPARVTNTLNLNDVIEFNLEYEEENDNILPVKSDLKIIFEDDSLLIVNKEPFTPVHPSENHFSDTLSNGVRYYFDSINLKKKIRPVNRLDKNTSGLVIFAKNEYIQECLSYQMQKNLFHKKYLAILTGILENKSGTINAPIARKNESIIEREINFKTGQKAITNYFLIKENNNLSLVEFELLTGRTHQIRVHSKYIGHPILGDSLYGSNSPLINRQALHAYKISFFHPIVKKELIIEIPLPKDMSDIV